MDRHRQVQIGQIHKVEEYQWADLTKAEKDPSSGYFQPDSDQVFEVLFLEKLVKTY